MSTGLQNHSKNYYISNENMSDIKESIDEYSMNFDRESGTYGNSKSEIAEMISGSHQATHSRAYYKGKSQHPSQPVIVEEDRAQNNQPAEEGNQKKAIYLGDHVYHTIRQRYFQTNKITTNDPQVLYDFFISQRKTIHTMKPITQKDIEKQMPSMQRKLMVKQQFQRILTYYPDDVYYTLCVEVEKIKKDKELTQKVQVFKHEVQKNTKKKVNKQNIDQIVEKLYNTKGNFGHTEKNISQEEVQRMKRRKFGKSLSEYYQNSYRERGSPFNIETAQKLHNFWQDSYEREEYGIEWDEDTAKQTIRRYMYEQVEDLMYHANRKLGFKCGKAMSLYKFYVKQDSVQNIYIPLNSFQEYVKEYNETEKRKIETEEDKAKENYEKNIQQRKKSEVKKFGRPVSATPLTILSKPKTQSTNLNQLHTKYPNDKVIKSLIAKQNLSKPRNAMEYGLYNMEEQVKTKQWIRIDPKKPQQLYDNKISQELYKTFTNPQFFKVHEDDRLMSLFAEEQLNEDNQWKQFGPLMKQAMLVKAFEHKWFVECIQRYVERTTGQKYKLETNNVLINRLFKHLNELDSDDRGAELQKLETLIVTSESIAEKTQKIQNLGGKNKMSQRQQNTEKKLLFVKLQEKAVQYVKMRIQKNDNKFTLRNYLNNLFQQVLKQHKDYVKKHYHVVEGSQKQCPKLLKYQFFKLVKEINPVLLERQQLAKSHVWVPSTGFAETKNYNAFADAYKKNKNIILPQPEKDELKGGLWGRQKRNDRSLLIMTYEDSKECTFQPKISRKM